MLWKSWTNARLTSIDSESIDSESIDSESIDSESIQVCRLDQTEGCVN